ncbi:MAG TPA: hypothetical protein VFD00_00060 [Thermoclostridium sp.]|nr:hypothetical protein [Thermoclostridium sp.]
MGNKASTFSKSSPTVMCLTNMCMCMSMAMPMSMSMMCGSHIAFYPDQSD